MRVGLRTLLGFVTAPSALVMGCLSSSTAPTPDAGKSDAGNPGAGSETLDGAAPDTTISPTPVEDAAPEASLPDAVVDAGSAGIDLTPGTLDFGSVNCGAVPPPNTLTFKNTGAAPLTYAVALASGAVFALQGSTSGSLPAGQTAMITIAPHTIPATSAAGVALTDTLTVTTNAPGSTSIAIALKVTPQGGALTITPPVATFGQEFLGVQAADIPLTITNTGNQTVSVSLGSPTDSEFATTWSGAPTAASLAPGASLSGAVARFKPVSAGPKSDSSAVVVQGALCAATEPSVGLTGTGTSAPIAISPGSLPFKPTACGSTAANLAVTLTNASATAVSYSSSLTIGTHYTLKAGTASGTVPANGTATITVVPGAVPRDPTSIATALSDTLNVTTGVGGGGAAATIPITQTGQGAVLAVTMPNQSFGPVVAGSPASLPFTVTNTGNVDAALTVTATGAGFSLTTDPKLAAAGSSAPGQVTYTASPSAAATGSLGVSTTANLCQAAQPTSLSLSATSEAPVASANSALLSFTVECTGPTAPTATLTITNTGTSNLVLSGVNATAGFSIVAATTTAIAPKGTGSIVVAASTTPLAGDRAGTPRTGTLSFTTNEYGAPSHTVSLSAALNGANLDYFSDAAHTAGITADAIDCGNAPVDPWWYCTYQGTNYYIYNSGNEAVTLAPPTFADSYLTLGPAVTSDFALAVGGVSVGTAPFWGASLSSPPSNCVVGQTTYNSSLSYTVASGNVCSALPALAIPVVGIAQSPCP